MYKSSCLDIWSKVFCPLSSHHLFLLTINYISHTVLHFSQYISLWCEGNLAPISIELRFSSRLVSNVHFCVETMTQSFEFIHKHLPGLYNRTFPFILQFFFQSYHIRRKSYVLLLSCIYILTGSNLSQVGSFTLSLLYFPKHNSCSFVLRHLCLLNKCLLYM